MQAAPVATGKPFRAAVFTLRRSMHSVYQSVQMCGSAAWLSVLLGLAGTIMGLIGVGMLAGESRRSAPRLGVIAIVLGLVAVGAGLVEQQMARSIMQAALASPTLDPSQKGLVIGRGTLGASRCVTVGAVSATLPFVLGALAVGLGIALRRKPAS
jgi:hypothetical protein